MSTRNVSEEARSARDALVNLDEVAKARVSAAKAARAANSSARRKLEKEKEAIRRGAVVATMAVNDDIAEIDESDADLTDEIMQLDASEIGGGTPEPPTAQIPQYDNDRPRAQPPVDEPARRRDQRNTFNFFTWKLWAWLFAALGVAIAFIVWIFTHNPLNDGGDIHGGGRAAVSIIWLIILLAIGFFAGGTVGSTIDDKEEANADLSRAA